MAAKLHLLLVATFLVFPGFASNFSSNVDSDTYDTMEELHVVIASAEDAAEKEAIFARSEDDHQKSMEALAQNMTNDDALAILEHNSKVTPAVLSLAGQALTHQGRQQRSSLRAGGGALEASNGRQPAGYSGVDKARNMLNDMIGESMEKYDLEIAKCVNYYSKQCGLMEACRGEIAAANYKAAHSRQLILAAQSQITISKVNLPKLTESLDQHKLKCKHETTSLKTRIAVVEGDISIMTMILKMTDCEASFVQKSLGLLHCKSDCGKAPFISFDDSVIRQNISALRTATAKQLLQDTFGDLVDAKAKPTVELVQGQVIQLLSDGNKTKPNNTKFKLPPVPRTEVPANPCNDPDAGAPSAHDKAAAKCSINRMPQCYKLQERFMLIQSGIMDERDGLKESLSSLEAYCEDTQMTLEADIDNEETMLKEEGAKLAEATTEESNAGEKARLVAKQHEGLAADLDKMMKSCSENYIAFESEQCGLKKIRGELAKLAGGPNGPAFFQDCKLSKWEPGECSKKCGGGFLTLERKVMTQPNGGAACLPLKSERRCNDIPCPVDCVVEPWSGWSRCSAECGGGVTQRVKEIKVQMMHKGEPCGEVSETKACNAQACEKDCELSDWSKWSKCSKECDGGTAKRQKFIKEAALGAGKCADPWSKQRLEYKHCNMHHCEKLTGVVQCHSKVDVILVLDGSGSLGSTGWKHTKKFAEIFTEAFASSRADVELAILLYSGPRTWSGVGRCMGETKDAPPSDPDWLDKICKLHWVQHFSADMEKTRANIDAMVWPKGGTLTSLAIGTASNELALGRKDASSIVVVVTDGRPLSFKRTNDASRQIRKSARLMWVPVSKFAPLKKIKLWAYRRWEENVVIVEDFKKLSGTETIDHLIADICPKVDHVDHELAVPEFKFG